MNVIDLSGQWRYSLDDLDDFSKIEYDDSHWPMMQVPSNWFLMGLDHHGVVWYRHRFIYQSPEQRENHRHRLLFEGVDYHASVYLNGEYLDEHSGYFEPFGIDISRQLRSGENILAVRVDSPFEPVGQDGWHMHKRLIKGVLNHHDCRPGGGWEAIGQSFNTGGIWNRVSLQELGNLHLDHMLLRADFKGNVPKLLVDLKLINFGVDRQVHFELTCRPENFDELLGYSSRYELIIPTGASRHKLVLDVPDVDYWQPWDRGSPNLYKILLSGDLQASDVFGFRMVKVDPEFNWTINGERYFPRGSNYIGSQWLSETLFPDVADSPDHPFGGHIGFGESARDRNWFEHDVELMIEANLNIIRVHAHVLPKEFYQACDRAGLLVWQDFPLQWGYSDDADFHEEAVEQAEAMVYLGYNHPCIVAWCCHNESPWDAEWMAMQSGGSYNPIHNRYLDSALVQTIRGLDPTRYIHMNSGSGDGHTYPGWYVGSWKDFKFLAAAPFPTEYGAQGLPVKDSLVRMFSELSMDAGYELLISYKKFFESKPNFDGYRNLPNLEDIPENLTKAQKAWDLWRFHNFQPHETFTGGRVNPGNSLDEFIENSQTYQNLVIQFGTETFRRYKYARVNGIFQFMFSDPWPAITWSVLDYWRIPKPSYKVLQRAMQPLLPCVDVWDRIIISQKSSIILWIVNDYARDFPNATCIWVLKDANDDILVSGELQLDLPGDSVTPEVDVSIPGFLEDSNRLELRVYDELDQLIGENCYNS